MKSRKILYSVMIAILPIMIIYGYSYITFADIIIFILMLVVVARNVNRVKCKKNSLPIILFLLIQPFAVWHFNKNISGAIDLFGTSWRLAFYMLAIGVISDKLLSKNSIIQGYRIVAIPSALYGILQFILGNFFKISLSVYLPFLPVTRLGLTSQQNNWIALGWIVRSRAWFTEPSTFAIFLIIGLFIEVFLVEKNKNNKSMIVLYVIALVISYSSTGMICLGLIFFIYLYELIKSGKNSRFIKSLLVIALSIVILMAAGVLTVFVDRTFANGRGVMSQSHFKSISTVLEEETNIWEVFIGHGLQDVAGGYLPGWIRLYYCLGVLGIFFYLVLLIPLFIRSNRNARILLLLFAILNIGTEIMLGINAVIFLVITFTINQMDGRSNIK